MQWVSAWRRQHTALSVCFLTVPAPTNGHRSGYLLVCAAPLPAGGDACTRLRADRAAARRGGRVAKLVDSLVSDAVKRLVLNPEYMRAAWMREVENSMIFGMTTDEMLVRGLDKESHRLPHFAGTHCYPIFPGDAAQYAPGPPAAPALPVAGAPAGAPAVQLCLALPEHEGCDCEGRSPRLHALAAHVLQIFFYLACC